MSETDKTQELAKEIAKELMAAQAKLFQDKMKKMQDEMSKLKEELSKKVDDAISGKKFEEATSGKNDNGQDGASDVGAREHSQPKRIYSTMNFDYS
jgi:predicted nuclease with TOPRIM domain